MVSTMRSAFLSNWSASSVQDDSLVLAMYCCDDGCPWKAIRDYWSRRLTHARGRIDVPLIISL